MLTPGSGMLYLNRYCDFNTDIDRHKDQESAKTYYYFYEDCYDDQVSKERSNLQEAVLSWRRSPRARAEPLSAW